MSRPSLKEQRRAEIVNAFARVLAQHGYEGATIARVADEAEMAPGMIHHYFDGKSELVSGLLTEFIARFRQRVRGFEKESPSMLAYINAAVELNPSADRIVARCWVGLFAEAIRNPVLFNQVRRFIDLEIEVIQKRSKNLSSQDAGAVLAFIIGALVLGAFAPKRVSGFAAPALQRLVCALQSPSPPLSAES